MMTKEASSFCLVMVTAPSEEEGKKIAQALLTEKLAACISMTAVESFYTWQGEKKQEREWQLFIKTRCALFSQLAETIQAVHSYDVPEIIALPMLAGSQPYLNWIANSTNYLTNS